MDDIFAINISDEDMSSSSDANSSQIEDRARFIAAQSRCANLLIHNSNGLPSMNRIRVSAEERPIMIDRSAI